MQSTSRYSQPLVQIKRSCTHAGVRASIGEGECKRQCQVGTDGMWERAVEKEAEEDRGGTMGGQAGQKGTGFAKSTANTQQNDWWARSVRTENHSGGLLETTQTETKY